MDIGAVDRQKAAAEHENDNGIENEEDSVNWVDIEAAVCDNCGGIGHLRRACPSRPTGKGEGKGKKGKSGGKGKKGSRPSSLPQFGEK